MGQKQARAVTRARSKAKRDLIQESRIGATRTMTASFA
jgi:hypothetical protein